MAKIVGMSVCVDCGMAFPYFREGSVPVRCPEHKDVQQKRPSVVKSRHETGFFPAVLITSLPGEWKDFRAAARDEPRWKIDVDGSQFGVSWSGRIVIFAEELFIPGDVVSVRVMKAVHQVRAKYGARVSTAMAMAGSENPTFHFRERLPVTAEEGEFEEETHEYLVLKRVGTKYTRRMAFARANSKITEKGLGAQYWSWIDASAAEWTREISGGVRGGRAHTGAVLAILPPEEVIVIHHAGHSGSGDPAGYVWDEEL